VDYCFPLPESVSTDKRRLYQILVNLVGNAVKFTARGGVRVGIQCLSGPAGSARMRFAVSDTGIGIAPERITDLFQPFMQVDASATRRYGGTGLGLAISKRLAQALGGDIEVTSESGAGSTFTLTIDIGSLDGVPMFQFAPTAAAVDEEIGARRQALALQGRVLLVEDVPAIEVVLSQILRKLNLEVHCAPNGRIACQLALKSLADGCPFDMILMDIQMPEMDGYEATSRLRSQGWQGPIVALTAHAMVGDREKCLRAGCDGYLAKPVVISELHAVLARYLKVPAVCSGPAAAAREAIAPSGLFADGFLSPGQIAELLAAFSAELPSRAKSIEDAWHKRDFQTLAEWTHQLKGTAGMYGFPDISALARVIHEHLKKNADPEPLRPTIAELVKLCQNAAQSTMKAQNLTL
jgi:CheY-like chemotaxis protein